MNRHPEKPLAAHRWPVAASLCGEPPESTQRVFPPQPPPVKRKKARWQAGLVKHFSSNNTRLVGLLIAASVTSGAAVAMVCLLIVRLIGGAL
ncbi:MAG TPA: hypothetical protein VMV78_07825 [Thiobacillus sp.]|nr:hypothetical protein [Thiobacillus sp.]